MGRYGKNMRSCCDSPDQKGQPHIPGCQNFVSPAPPMTIDKDGLAAAAIQLAALRGVSVADEVDQAMFGADAAKVITAYLSALPNTKDIATNPKT